MFPNINKINKGKFNNKSNNSDDTMKKIYKLIIKDS